MKRNNVKIGLFGFGCVGQGLFSVLKNSNGFKPEIKKICVKHKEKDRNIDAEHLTFDKYEILDDPEINVIVELTDDFEAAFEIVKEALKKGKSVVTANKKMVSEYFRDIQLLIEKYNRPFLYEAACCASIPIIRNFEEYYDNDIIYSFYGIMNGTTNFILTEMSKAGKPFKVALKAAQIKGYAESNPTNDIEGFDSKYKLCILLNHAFGVTVKPKDILNFGIERINEQDIRFASVKNGKIKLIALAQKLKTGGIAAFVIPQLILEKSELYNIDGVDNGIVTENYFADKNIFVGKGAGAIPTAAAVLSDLSALSYDYKYEYKKNRQLNNHFIDNDFIAEVYVRFQNNHNDIKDNFEKIQDEHYSKNHNYITGKIKFNKLLELGCFKRDDVNVILLDNYIQ